MSRSLIRKIEGAEGPKKVSPISENGVKRPTHRPHSPPGVPRPAKRRGPIVAGGIIRFDLGRPRSDE
jgi:hypothetical protein